MPFVYQNNQGRYDFFTTRNSQRNLFVALTSLHDESSITTPSEISILLRVMINRVLNNKYRESIINTVSYSLDKGAFVSLPCFDGNSLSYLSLGMKRGGKDMFFKWGTVDCNNPETSARDLVLEHYKDFNERDLSEFHLDINDPIERERLRDLVINHQGISRGLIEAERLNIQFIEGESLSDWDLISKGFDRLN